jgi:hypothetical protein
MSVLKKMMYGLAAVATTVAITTATGTSAQAAGHTSYGCPSGAACLYSGVTPEEIARGPIAIWWTGVQQLHDVYGRHAIQNNQYGGWTVELCRGWYGTDCPYRVDQGLFGFYDFTPINSVYLHP